MNLRLESATLDGFAISGGANGLSVAKFSWTKSPRTQRRARPRAHGSVDLTRYYEGRFYNLAGVLRGLDEEDAQARLDAFEEALALTGDAVNFQFLMAGRTEAEQADVRIDGDLDYAFDVEEPGVVRWALTLFAEDPRRYGTTLRSGFYDPTTAGSGGGVDFFLYFPLDFGADETSPGLQVENEGNFNTPPVFTITGPVTNPIIDNDSTGETLTTQELSLADGEQAVIDVASRTLSLSDVSRPDLIDPAATDWIELQPGVNQLRLRGSDIVSGTTLAVSFNDARI